MEVFEIILKLVIGIGILIVFGYLMSFVFGAISKLFGTTSTMHGNVVSTPDTLDENIRELKEVKDKFITSFKKYTSKFNEKHSININEQIRLLGELEKLKRSKAISDVEYFSLKEKIISK